MKFLSVVQQEGRLQRYRANLPLMAGLVAYLTAECCAGHPEQCAELHTPLRRAKNARSTKPQA